MTQIDHAVSEYLEELEREAELARDDLAELEDHMRSLVDELLSAGASTEHAIAQAKLRLGDPKTIAREHARVRSPFGAKLSRTRAWSAGGLFLALVVLDFVMFGQRSSLFGYFVIEALIGIGMGVALLARFAWARAAVGAFILYGLLHLGASWIAFDNVFEHWDALSYVMLALQVGVLAFVIPWRRGEIGPAGYALGLVVVMYTGASWVINLETWKPAVTPASTIAHVALLSTLLAGIGIVMRARWASAMAAIATASLAVAGVVMFDSTLPHWDGGFFYAMPNGLRELMLGNVIAGAVAALVCTRLSWRVAKTGLGSLRGFAS